MRITWIGSGKNPNSIEGIMSCESVFCLRQMGYEIDWFTHGEFEAQRPRTRVVFFQDVRHIRDFERLRRLKAKRGLVLLAWAYADTIDLVARWAGLFDHVFESSESAVVRLRRQGIAASWLPFAAPSSFQPIPDITGHPARLAFDVAFIGSAYPPKENRVQEWLGEVFAMGARGQLRLFLAGKGRPQGFIARGQIPAIYAQTAVLVHVTIPEEAEEYKSPALRVLEGMGCARLMVTDPWRGVDDVFQDGREIAVARQPADFARLVKHYLEHIEERERIAWAGYEAVEAGHRYEHRMGEVDRVIRAKEG